MTDSVDQASAFSDSRFLNSCDNTSEMFALDKDMVAVLMIVQSSKCFWDSVTLTSCCAVSQFWKTDEPECACSELSTRHWGESINCRSETEVQQDELTNGGNCSKKRQFVLLKYRLEGIYLSVFLKELKCSKIYRCLVIDNLVKRLKKKNSKSKMLNIIQWNLQDNLPQIIDYEWNDRMIRNAQERQHLDTAMSWLSTLGGACSALGDYNRKFAERAGKISFQQMDIALRIGDPGMVSRCRLYIAISLIQQYRFKTAAAIIKHEYLWAYSIPSEVRDQRLINMCKGIWTKLKYERKLYKQMKTVS